MLLAYLLSLATASLLYCLLRLIQRRRFYKDLPKPPHSFLWGHLKLFGEVVKLFPANSHPQVYYTALAQKYNLPGIFYVDLWPVGPAQMIITDPDAATQVTTLHPYSQHQMSADFIEPMLGKDVIATVNGPTWRLLHHMMAPAFAPAYTRSMIGPIAEETMRFHGKLHQLAESGVVFSMEETAAALLFDVIGHIVFGFPLNAQRGGSEILTNLRNTLDFYSLGRQTVNPLTKLSYHLKKRDAILKSDAYLTPRILERYNTLKGKENLPNRKEATSILDRFLIEKLQLEEQAGRVEDTIDPKFLQLTITNMKALLVGGHGTTTDTLCFIYILLSLHPDAMKRLREEHDAIFDRDHEATFNMLREAPQKVGELEYTTAVIKEALRLFPVGFGGRQANERTGDVLEYKGKTYPTKDQLIIPCQHTMHYDERNYPEPAKFKPERFLDPDNITRRAWRPFSRGARACLGQNLAMDEMRVFLVLTARSFDFECVNVQPNSKPRVPFTDLDLRLGDLAFQELGLEAKPRGKVMMRVHRALRK